MGKISDWTDGTIGRICEILEGKGECSAQTTHTKASITKKVDIWV
jgi:hypothetical protein